MLIDLPARGATSWVPGGTEIALARLQQFGVSRREAQVLGLVLTPYPNSQIASQLGISTRTVESHIAALLRKFGVTDRSALIRAATQLGDEPNPTAKRVPERQLRERRADAATTRLRVVRQQNILVLSQAAQLEQTAVALHESVARRHDDLADRLCRRAIHEVDEDRRIENYEKAAIARQRANSARLRAAEVRQRLDAKRPEAM